MKLWWSLILVLAISMMAITVQANSDMWEEEDDGNEMLVRTVRGTKGRAAGGDSRGCRYVKGQWSECDLKTNTRQRTLSLKKGNKTCEQTRVIQKKCNKACRYIKGTFGACTGDHMTRVDEIDKQKSDSSCAATRHITQKCKPDGTNTKKAAKADRANRKSGKQ